MRKTLTLLAGAVLTLALSAGQFAASAAGTNLGTAEKQGANIPAIAIFVIFVLGTLYITYRAAMATRTANDFYAAGGEISPFRNALAIAGDYMSAASFLGISSLVFSSGYDGLIYSIGFLVGWPIVLFLIAERLRNLGRYTFADVASFRLAPTPIRTLSAVGTLVVVALYMIAQMVGAGQLIELLFHLDYLYAVVIVGALMIVYVAFGGMKATTWVQVIKACLLLVGATLLALSVLWHFGFNPDAMFAQAVAVHPKGDAIMAPGGFVKDRVSTISLGLCPDVRNRRPAAYPDALLHGRRREGGTQIGVLCDRPDRLLLRPHFRDRIRRDHLSHGLTRATSRSARTGTTTRSRT